jgi:GGDEF domain-containing protein
MNIYLIYASFGIGAILAILSSILYRKWRIWKFLLLLFMGISYGIYLFKPEWIPVVTAEEFLEVFGYILYAIVVLIAMGFKSKIKITQNLTDYDFFEMEKELDEIKSDSELLRLRYISTIGLVNDALLFYNDELDGFFVTEQFQKIIDTKQTEFTMDEYIALIHVDDRNQYLSTIKKINKKTPAFDLKYRLNRNGVFVWVEERAKIFEYDKKIQVISIIHGIDIKLFPDTMIHEIDSLPSEQHLVQFLTQASKEPEAFYLVMIHLTNIPEINQRFGRDVGNLMIAEYIRKMRYHFAKDLNSIFRITGIQFALIIKEQKKYDVLLRALQSGGDLINLAINIGGIQQVVYPKLGVVKHEPWSTYSLNEFIGLATKSLDEAIRNTKRNYSIFGE